MGGLGFGVVCWCLSCVLCICRVGGRDGKIGDIIVSG